MIEFFVQIYVILLFLLTLSWSMGIWSLSPWLHELKLHDRKMGSPTCQLAVLV